MNFFEKLQGAQQTNNSWLCVGIDPSPQLLPAGVDVFAFGKQMVDATSDLVCAYKLHLAFYLTFGADGFKALQDTIAHIPDHIPVVLDAKFGDIGYSAEHYARVAYDLLGADAVTVSPYVGMDAVTPLLDYADKCVFVLVRSANTTSNDFQLWPNETAPLFRYVTAQLNTLAGSYPMRLGLGVAATQPHDLTRIRSWAPSLPFLIPGIGTQGGNLELAVTHGRTRTGIGPIISVTRSIIYAGSQNDFADSARRAATEWVNRIRATKSAS